MNKPLRLLACAIFGLGLAVSSATRAATLVWTNTAGGDWSQASSWKPN